MNELLIDKTLVGKKVQVPGRPDWGAGKVLKVLSTTSGGAPLHRVTVQFAHGTRTLVSPPAKLMAPQEETERAAVGWLESIGGRTVDDRLKCVPEDVLQVLGTLRQRLIAVFPLYRWTDDPKSLARWAMAQTHLADPLSHWSRDELSVAFAAFCSERDAHLRNLAALLRHTEGPEALQEALAELEPRELEAVKAALARPI